MRRRSLASWLALAYALLVGYASLYPFAVWQLPPGTDLLDVLSLPWPRWWLGFDVVSNLLGYLPLGLMLFAAAVRSGFSLRQGVLAGLLLPVLLSFFMESLQHFLPSRVPSLADWLLNSLGALLGVGLGALIHALGGLERWETLRDRWFLPHSEGALALLLLWPVGLLFPAPVPLGQGQVLPRLRESVLQWLSDTPLDWATAGEELLMAPNRALPPGIEAITIALGLLAPTLVALSVAQAAGWRKLGLVVGALLLGTLTTTFSTAMSFGPQHALAWLTQAALWGLGLGAALALLLSLLAWRATAACGLVVVTALIALVSSAPTDPYFAQSLASWEQGRFIRFHGVAQWVGWLWPFAALWWLLARVSRREVTSDAVGRP
jgi:VanZ family protein